MVFKNRISSNGETDSPPKCAKVMFREEMELCWILRLEPDCWLLKDKPTGGDELILYRLQSSLLVATQDEHVMSQPGL